MTEPSLSNFETVQISCTNSVALVSLFLNIYVSLKKNLKFFDYSSKVYLYVTCFQKKNRTKCIVECLAKSLVLQSTSFAKLSALSSDPFPLHLSF